MNPPNSKEGRAAQFHIRQHYLWCVWLLLLFDLPQGHRMWLDLDATSSYSLSLFAIGSRPILSLRWVTSAICICIWMCLYTWYILYSCICKTPLDTIDWDHTHQPSFNIDCTRIPTCVFVLKLKHMLLSCYELPSVICVIHILNRQAILREIVNSWSLVAPVF